MDGDLDKDVYVDVYELERKVGELYRKLGEGCLIQSSKTVPITTKNQLMDLA